MTRIPFLPFCLCLAVALAAPVPTQAAGTSASDETTQTVTHHHTTTKTTTTLHGMKTTTAKTTGKTHVTHRTTDDGKATTTHTATTTTRVTTHKGHSTHAVPTPHPPAARSASPAAGVHHHKPHVKTLPAVAAPAPAPAAAPSPPVAKPAPPPVDPNKGTATGLPLPRFAALRSDRVNLRTGPGTRYPIDWQYLRRDLPVKIEREFEVWRLISQSDGTRGWVHLATLTGRRSFLITGDQPQTLREAASDSSAPVAILKPGVVGRLVSCAAASDWCSVQVKSYQGYLNRNAFWGTLPGEAVGQ